MLVLTFIAPFAVTNARADPVQRLRVAVQLALANVLLGARRQTLRAQAVCVLVAGEALLACRVRLMFFRLNVSLNLCFMRALEQSSTRFIRNGFVRSAVPR